MSFDAIGWGENLESKSFVIFNRRKAAKVEKTNRPRNSKYGHWGGREGR